MENKVDNLKLSKYISLYISEIGGKIKKNKYGKFLYAGEIYICDLNTDMKFLRFLIKHKISKFECMPYDKYKHAQIGFSEKEQKWYGWSHRAIFGFGIGYIAKKGDCCTMSGWTDDFLKKHPEYKLSVPVGFEVKSLDDAKKVAIAFAECVS